MSVLPCVTSTPYGVTGALDGEGDGDWTEVGDADTAEEGEAPGVEWAAVLVDPHAARTRMATT